jgi:hypothetical protein
MANNFLLKTKSNIGVSTVGIYTVPANTTTVIIGLSLANTKGSGINVGIGITRSSADSINLIKNVPIPQGSTLEFMQGNKIVLQATDTLTAICDVNNSLDIALTIMEIT